MKPAHVLQLPLRCRARLVSALHSAMDSSDNYVPAYLSSPAKKKQKSTPTPKRRKRAVFQSSGDSIPPQDVLEPVEQLRVTELETKKTLSRLNQIGISNVKSEVEEMDEDSVIRAIEKSILIIADSVFSDRGFVLQVPSRSSSNQLYVPELDRIVLKDKVSLRDFLNQKHNRKLAIMMRILQLVYEICSKNIHVTKRDLFYTDVKLFKAQSESDDVLDDTACFLSCTRSSLNVVASEKGVVVGRLSFRDDGDLIDCTRMGSGGKAIPPFIDKISDITGDAKFILLVEKDAAFLRLAEDRFYNQYPCIILTAKGQPDVATRMFLKRLKAELKIPILGLVDSDPYGLKILSVYMSGSKNMSYDSASLTTRDIHWLGVRPSDLDRYNIPQQCRLAMTEHDLRTGKELLQEDFITKNPEWVKELELMVSRKEKAEIQALSSFGFQYLTQVYLPEKLRQGDWL